MSTHFRIARTMPRFVASAPTGNLADYYAAVLGDSPWGFWKQLETSGTTLADASGAANALAIGASGATLAQTGPDGTTANAIDWANLNDSNAVSGSTFLPQANGVAATFECWVKVPSGGVSTITAIMSATNGTNSTNMVLFFDAAGKINGRVFTSSSFLITSASAVSAGWHHIVQTVGPAGHEVRVDKVTVASSATPTQAGASNQLPLKLFVHRSGQYANANGFGAIRTALPAAYLSQLSGTQIAAHYDALI